MAEDLKLRQRAMTFEKVVNAVVVARPEPASSMEPGSLAPVTIRDVAETVGMHESTIKRVAIACRFRTLHGMVAFEAKDNKLGFVQR